MCVSRKMIRKASAFFLNTSILIYCICKTNLFLIINLQMRGNIRTLNNNILIEIYIYFSTRQFYYVCYTYVSILAMHSSYRFTDK